MSEIPKGDTPQRERGDDGAKEKVTFRDFLATVPGVSLESLKATFGEAYMVTHPKDFWKKPGDELVDQELLNKLKPGVDGLREWVIDAEKRGSPTLEQGKAKLADYEAVVGAMEKLLAD